MNTPKLLFNISIFIIVICTSCEKIISLSNVVDIQKIVLNAFITPDTTIMVSITRSYPTNDSPIKIERYFYGFGAWVYDYNVGSYNFDADGNASYNLRRHTIKNAKAHIIVNDTDRYDLLFNQDNCLYEASYRPNAGDKITLFAEGYPDSTNTSSLQQASSEIFIPRKPNIEILNYKFKFKEKTAEYIEGFGWMATGGDIDSVLCIKIKMSNLSNSKNYYCLKVRSYTYNHKQIEHIDDWHPSSGYHDPIHIPADGPLIWHVNDTYRSDDILFRDDRLHSPNGGWGKYFSNVFDDALFQNGEYTVEIETPLINAIEYKRWVRVELQSISEDYYRYLKGVMLFKMTEDNFAEDVYIHSNVDNGYGIIAATNSHVKSFKVNNPL